MNGIRGQFASLAFVVTGFLSGAAPDACAALINGGFEEGGGSLNGWSTFNNSAIPPNVSSSTASPHSGSYVAKIFGGFNGSPNYSGIVQNLPASPGQLWEAVAFARHNDDDSLLDTQNELLIKLEFYRVAGGAYGSPDMLQESGTVMLDRFVPPNVWALRTFSAIAPPNTVEVRLAFVFVQRDNASGSVLLDDITLSPEPAGDPIEWDLVWSDEFDAGGVDSSKWRVEDIHIIKNNEQQYYTPEDVYTENGNLVLRSQQRMYYGMDTNGSWRWFNYTSGLVESRNRFATAYGRIEVRAKLPATQGIWPAHWMLPTSDEWPPEIDIMELLGHEPTRVHMTHHWGDWPNVQRDGSSYSGPDFSQGFHTFTVEWMPDRIDWFVDDVLRYRSVVSIPQEPFYVILNTAVGGEWPGYPDGTTVFPQYHKIDYVRVYVPADGDAPLAEFDDTTPDTAVADGELHVDEYISTSTGINAGFGDIIGAFSKFRLDSASDGRLSFAIESATPWADPSSDGVVIYIDSQAGGYASTVEFVDVQDRSRRLVSGKSDASGRSDLYFALGFRADYAVCLEVDQVNLYRVDRTQHQWIGGAVLDAAQDMDGLQEVAYRLDDGAMDFRLRELELRLSHLGMSPGATFDFVVTTLDGDTAYRSNEFVGVAPGNSWDLGNVGVDDAILKIGDFVRFHTTAEMPAVIPATSAWGLIVATLILLCAGTIRVGQFGIPSTVRG